MDPKEDASVGVNTENHHGEPPLVPAEIDDDPLTSSPVSYTHLTLPTSDLV